MKPTSPDRIRNVALISHGGAGKTSLAEAMLFDAGAINRLGSIEAGTTTLDWDPDEQKHRQSINLAVATLEHEGVRITLVDTPGYADFQADVIEALAAADAVIVVVDASAGVEVGTEEVWRLADARGLPRMIFVNKMDRENANYDAVLEQLKARFGPKIAPVYLPIGSAATFRGYVDVIEEHATVYENGTPKEVPIPADLEGIEHRAGMRSSRRPPRRATSSWRSTSRARSSATRRSRRPCTRARARAAWCRSSSAPRP